MLCMRTRARKETGIIPGTTGYNTLNEECCLEDLVILPFLRSLLHGGDTVWRS